MDCIKTTRLILDAAILDLEDLIEECFNNCVKTITHGIKNNLGEIKKVILFGPYNLFSERPEYDLLTTLKISLRPLDISRVVIPNRLSYESRLRFCDKYRTNVWGKRIEGIYSIYTDCESLYSISGLTGKYKDVKELEKRKGTCFGRKATEGLTV